MMITLIVVAILIASISYSIPAYRAESAKERMRVENKEQKQLLGELQDTVDKYKTLYETEAKIVKDITSTSIEYAATIEKILLHNKQLVEQIEVIQLELRDTIEATNSISATTDTLIDANAKLQEELDSHEAILEKAVEMADAPARIAPMPIELNCPCGIHKQMVAVDLRHKHQDYKCSRCNKTCGIQVNLLTTQIPQGATVENYPLATQVGVTDLTEQA